MKKNLVLLGMMGVGKSTLGKMVAEEYNFEFIDTDTIIEEKNLMNINEIFQKKGEQFFRQQEEKEILNVLKRKNCIIALGGGAFINKKIRDQVLNETVSIWLDIDIKILIKRVEQNKKRPLLRENDNLTKLKELYEERKEIYKLANYKIECDSLNKKDITKKIINLYDQYKNKN